MSKLFKLKSFNLNLNSRERHWVNFILFGLHVSLNRTRIGMTSSWFDYWTHSTTNKTICVFGRVTVTKVG